MPTPTKRNRVAWLFVISMVVLCGSLAFLQDRWTGDVARAEMTLLSESLTHQAGQLCKAFDGELLKSRLALVPTSSELDNGKPEEVHSAKLRQWKSAKPLPVFKRLAVAVISGDKLDLLEMDTKSGLLKPMEWPVEWNELRYNLLAMLLGGPPPDMHTVGMLREFPVMRERTTGERDPRIRRSERPGREEWHERMEPPERRLREWVIFELDTEYIRETWLPELVAKFLNPHKEQLYNVVVRTRIAPYETIFSSGPGPLAGGEKALAVDFNYFGSSPERLRGGPPSIPRWTLEISHLDGALEDIVAESRRRNLAIAGALNMLILASGAMLLRTTRRSRKVAEERMRFVANVTHELRTPLTVIRGAAYNLKRGIVKDPNGIEKYSGLIIEHAESLSAMVDQVLDLSGGRRGRTIRVPVDLGQALRDAVLTIKGDPKFSSCQINLHLPENLPVVIGDPPSLRRAFQNLLENAAKHGGAGGAINITVVAHDNWVEIRVSDQGPGIPEDEIDDIFTPFFRGIRSRSNQVRGSGLGLSLVKGIVEAHGGGISVNSEVGKGSTFTVSLPL